MCRLRRLRLRLRLRLRIPADNPTPPERSAAYTREVNGGTVTGTPGLRASCPGHRADAFGLYISVTLGQRALGGPLRRGGAGVEEAGLTGQLIQA